jgi:hypothetical protein
VLGSGFDLIARIVTQSADETTAVQQDLATSVTSREFGQMVTEDPTFLAEGNLTAKVQGKPVLTGFKIKGKNYNLETTLGSVLPFLCCCLSGILWRKKRRKDNDEKNEAVKYENTQDALGALGVAVAGITNPTKK